MDEPTILGFAAVSLAVIAVPGPSVVFAVNRAIASGRRIALLTLLGNAAGLFVQVIFVAAGLGLIVTGSDRAYALLKLLGAAYLIWLGASAIRHRHHAAQALWADAPSPTSRPWREGFVIGLTNPKSAVLLAALLPQYADRGTGLMAVQMAALGGLFCLIAIASDGLWVTLAASCRGWFTRDPRRLGWAAAAGGLVMVTLGLALLAS